MNKRDEFYSDIIVCAIENYGYGWFYTLDYDCGIDNERMPTATIEDKEDEEDKKKYFVDRKVFSKAFSSIRNKPTNKRTPWECRMIEAYTETDAGMIDVVDVINLLEIGLFGEVVYS